MPHQQNPNPKWKKGKKEKKKQTNKQTNSTELPFDPLQQLKYP